MRSRNILRGMFGAGVIAGVQLAISQVPFAQQLIVSLHGHLGLDA